MILMAFCLKEHIFFTGQTEEVEECKFSPKNHQKGIFIHVQWNVRKKWHFVRFQTADEMRHTRYF